MQNENEQQLNQPDEQTDDVDTTYPNMPIYDAISPKLTYGFMGWD